MIVKRRYETFVLGFPSLIALQSNHLLVSHSNQMDLQKNSVIPNNLAQISRELYDMKSIQYGNTPSSTNMNTHGVKTRVPTKKSMHVSVDKGFPISIFIAFS